MSGGDESRDAEAEAMEADEIDGEVEGVPASGGACGAASASGEPKKKKTRHTRKRGAKPSRGIH